MKMDETRETRDVTRIKIVYFGTPQFSAYILEELINFCSNSDQFEIKTVVTSPDKPVGRKQIITPSETSIIADKYKQSFSANKIPTLKPAKLTPEFLENNKELLTSDLFIVAAYGKIIPQSYLDIPKQGAINVHGSVLPSLRGASPIQQAILDGEKETGITIMLMDKEMDHGDILTIEKTPIEAGDTYQSLSNKLSQIGAKLLITTVQEYLDGKVNPKPQDHSKATYTMLIKKEDGYFDISNPPTPEVLDRMIRAYYPWPNAWTVWEVKSKKLKVKLLPNQMIQIEGKNPISLKDFLNGYPDFPLKDF